MAWERTYTDEQLVTAIAASFSWRGTLRELGLVATSSGAMRSVRSQADRLGLDYSHFTGQRRWTEERLRIAVATAHTWPEVADILGLQGGSAIATIKGHATRLGLSVSHLAAQGPVLASEAPAPDMAHLARAGSLLAAAWFTLCGHDVSWPLEPSRYDLLVRTDLGIRRVQVKTTTTRTGNSWQVFLSTTRRGRRTYDPDEIDDFLSSPETLLTLDSGRSGRRPACDPTQRIRPVPCIVARIVPLSAAASQWRGCRVRARLIGQRFCVFRAFWVDRNVENEHLHFQPADGLHLSTCRKPSPR